MEDGRLEAEIKELICYLWDNYIQLYDADEVFIMGVGYAYIGIKMLLLNRSEASPPGKLSFPVCFQKRSLPQPQITLRNRANSLSLVSP